MNRSKLGGATACLLVLCCGAATLAAAQNAAAPAAATPPSAPSTATPAPASSAAPASPAAAPAAAPEKPEPPRRSYNQGRAAYQAHDLAAAEKNFLAARDQAEADAEVRYRAAFNLALTYAQKADGLAKEKPQDALAALQQSAAWFRDAVHGRPEDPDARHNLELVLRRAQQLLRFDRDLGDERVVLQQAEHRRGGLANQRQRHRIFLDAHNKFL